MPPVKLITGRNYGSIPHLSDSKLGEHDKYIHPGQERIIRSGGRDKHDEVIVSIKLDGTNVGVLKTKGKLVTLQRKGYDCQSSPYRQHHEFDAWVQREFEQFDRLLRDGERIVGEWLWQASGIQYRVQAPSFLAFDLFVPADAGVNRLNWSDLQARLTTANVSFGLPAFRRYRRKETPVTALADMPNFPQVVPLSAKAHEGLVYRVERKGKFDFMAKWVRSDYTPGAFLPGIGLPKDADLVRNKVVSG